MNNSILKYFPDLSATQISQFEAMGVLYPEWNAKINVISRKDIDNLYTNHILHSLSIARFMTPVDGTTFLDMGTGGGFPGIPFAAMFPNCHFHLIDRIGKKAKGRQSQQHEDGKVGLAHLENVFEDNGEDDHHHQRIGERPQAAQSLVLVARLEILGHER